MDNKKVYITLLSPKRVHRKRKKSKNKTMKKEEEKKT